MLIIIYVDFIVGYNYGIIIKKTDGEFRVNETLADYTLKENSLWTVKSRGYF